jgi:hypothetical protein
MREQQSFVGTTGSVAKESENLAQVISPLEKNRYKEEGIPMFKALIWLPAFYPTVK